MHVATVPSGSVLVDAPESRNPKVILVYRQELPNVPDKTIEGVRVECGPGAYHLVTRIPTRLRAIVLEVEIPRHINDAELLRAARRPPRWQTHPSKTKPATLLAVFVVDTTGNWRSYSGIAV